MNLAANYILRLNFDSDKKLFQAVNESNYDEVDKALKSGASSECLSLEKEKQIYISPLQLAIKKNNLTMVKFLIAHDVPVNNDEMNDWHWAYFGCLLILNSLPVVAVLKTFWHILEEKHDDAFASLIMTVVGFMIREFLVVSIKEARTVINQSPSPLCVAQAHGYIEIEKFLKEKGARLKRREEPTKGEVVLNYSSILRV